jgi:hypothetical protein
VYVAKKCGIEVKSGFKCGSKCFMWIFTWVSFRLWTT